MNYLDIVDAFSRAFRVEKKPNFLHMTTNDEHRMSFAIDIDPQTVTWSDVLFHLKEQETENRIMGLPYAAISAQSRVAQSSRRAAGNMFFADHELCAEIYQHQLSMVEGHYFSNAVRIPIFGFEPRLLITTYNKVDAWKEREAVRLLDPDYTSPTSQELVKVSIVDGPLALFEDTLYANSNWKKYFFKTLVA